MKLKTYTASTMAQALAQVRKDLGTDAMILHTRSYRTGSWLGLGGKPMVEITASSPQPTKPRKSRRVKQAPAAQPIAAQSDRFVEETVPEIVVQRSRMAQPVAAQSQESYQPEANVEEPVEVPVDDRAALLQGLMGIESSPIRDRRTDSFDRKENQPPQEQRKIQTPIKAPKPPKVESRDDEFQATTFRTIDQVEPEKPAPAQDRFVLESPTSSESFQFEIHEPKSLVEPKPLIERGSDEVFELTLPHQVKDEVKPKVEPKDELEVEPEIKIIDAKAAADSPKIYETVIAQSPPESSALQSQIDTLQKMMGQVLDSTRRTAVAVNKTNQDSALPPVEMSEPLHAVYTEMIDNDVSIELADRFVGAVRDRLDADELADASVIRHALLREIESSIQTVSDSILTKSRTDDEATNLRPNVIALIGPTGVGKTTTVAKLAATAKLRHGKRVALITSDTYRIAAVEQLKTYASIIGLEFRIANSPEEMESVIDSLEDVDLVVIDTAGRSQNNHARLDELGQLISAAKPDETHLVLSSTVGDNVLRKTAERFMGLGPDRCILTKIDEAVTTGMIAGMGDRIGLPLSFVTVGQEVPDDILPARAERLARAVLDGPIAVVPSL